MADSSINKHVSKHVTLPFFFDFWEIEINQSAHAQSHNVKRKSFIRKHSDHNNISY